MPCYGRHRLQGAHTKKNLLLSSLLVGWLAAGHASRAAAATAAALGSSSSSSNNNNNDAPRRSTFRRGADGGRDPRNLPQFHNFIFAVILPSLYT